MIKLGKIIGTFGIKGELKIYPLTNFMEMFLDFDSIFIKDGEDYKKIEVSNSRIHKNTVLLLFKGISSINDAERFIGKEIYQVEELLPELNEDEEYLFNLIGLKVYQENEDFLGTIADVFDNGAHSVYVLKDDTGSEILIPVIEGTIVSKDVEGGKLVVKILPGLLD